MAMFVLLNAMGQCFLMGLIMLIPRFLNAASNTTAPWLLQAMAAPIVGIEIVYFNILHDTAILIAFMR